MSPSNTALRALGTLLLGLCLLAHAAPSQAWGWLGHQLVADLGEAGLQPAAAQEVKRLLALEGKTRLHEVSGWADEVRELDDYAWSSPLHYVNFPGHGCDHGLQEVCADGDCVIAAVSRFRAELEDRSLTDARRLEALKFLVHFVGDIHQPLHAGRGDDKGGNEFQTHYRGKGGSLHGIWDYELLGSRGLERAAYTALLQGQPAPAVATLEPLAWAQQACAVVNAGDFYPPRHRIGEDYIEAKRPQAEHYLRLAGVRLAAHLNAALAAAPASISTP